MSKGVQKPENRNGGRTGGEHFSQNLFSEVPDLAGGVSEI
jgi:hypothetical protein